MYEGRFENDQKNGEGLLTLADGSSYQGHFKNGIIEGFGIYKWKNQKKFEGDWMNNKMNGYGKLIWYDGVEYIGQFLDDKFHGQGQYKWPDGKMYVGGWLAGRQHGEGKLLFANKMKIGKWNNGVREGSWIQIVDNPSGTIISDIESQYAGSWKSGYLPSVSAQTKFYSAKGSSNSQYSRAGSRSRGMLGDAISNFQTAND